MEGGWEGRRRREDKCGRSPDTAPCLPAQSHPSSHQKTHHFSCLSLEMAKAMAYALDVWKAAAAVGHTYVPVTYL